MATIFPSNPQIDDIYQGYKWNGVAWKLIGIDLAIDYAPIDSPTITGTVTLPSTTSIGTVSSSEIAYLDGLTAPIATEDYVDTAISGFNALPSQSGHSGEFLTTNGSITSWGAVDVSGAISSHNSDTTDVHGITNTADLATQSYVSTAISNLIDSAPSTLNTLNELAAAINDDASFASTITTALGNKLDSSTAASTYAPINSPTFTGTVSGITKSMVGLGNVENTALSTWAGSQNITIIGNATAPELSIGNNPLDIYETTINILGPTGNNIGSIAGQDGSQWTGYPNTIYMTAKNSDFTAYSRVATSSFGYVGIGIFKDSTWAELGFQHDTTDPSTISISNGVWNGKEISTSKGGTGLTSIGSSGQILKVNSSATGLEWGIIDTTPTIHPVFAIGGS